MQRYFTVTALGLLFVLASCSDPDDVPDSHLSTTPVSPVAEAEITRNPNKNAYFGDLHVHTSWSIDAYAGESRVGPATAYRFARGDMVELPNGSEAKLDVPLDFVAITDHAEGFATHLVCTIPGNPEFDTDTCRRVRADLDQETLLENAFERGVSRPSSRDPVLCTEERMDWCLEQERSTWQRFQELANAYNDPGNFTTLIGYEFSALLPDFGMLHRNVIFRGSDVIAKAISAQDVANQREFFAQLDEACQPPCDVLTIPHNTNYSWGIMFSRTDEDGENFSAADLERRAKMDRLFEITQIKGNSECQLYVGASDEDCNFGNTWPVCEPGQETKCAKPASFYRNVLLDGLAIGTEGGLNPNKMGAIGSTDTHQSDPGNTAGMISQFEPYQGIGFAVSRLLEANHIVAGPVRKFSPGGLAAVWAEANTRDDIYDALHNREAFATSGSRLKIRFFAGDFGDDMGEDPVATGYAKGVPMGGDLVSDSPSFWVWASRDPMQMPLDRIQVIKGWVENGEQMHQVRDVACSGDRVPGPDGKCPATTASIDIENCEPTGEAGAPELQATFTDPAYNPAQPAFYYVRVFENPSCRWTTELARSADEDLPTDVPAFEQERGWSSPIWVSSP